jgi:Flp pilus assembly protein TadD
LRAGDRELAVTTLGKAAERFKDHPSVHLALGRVWLTAAEMSLDPADMREALEALGPVASQSTATSETLGLYGRALALSGQYGRASVALKQAAQRFPIDPEVLLHYAAVAERLGQLPTARDALLQYSALIDDERDDAAHAERIAALTHRIQAR